MSRRNTFKKWLGIMLQHNECKSRAIIVIGFLRISTFLFFAYNLFNMHGIDQMNRCYWVPTSKTFLISTLRNISFIQESTNNTRNNKNKKNINSCSVIISGYAAE